MKKGENKMEKKFKLFKFISLLFIVIFCVVLFNFKPVNASGGSQGETWVLNENINLSALSILTNFTSNNESFNKIEVNNEKLFYLENNEPPKIVWQLGGGWVIEAYRTVTFNTAPTGNLLAWLEVNAVKVVEVELVEIGTNAEELQVGRTYQINPTVLPENATAEVTYYSNNEEVATVSDGGLVSAVAEGTAVITVKAGAKQSELTITVPKKEVLTEVTLTIGSFLTAILGWLGNAFTSVTGIFYNAETGFTLVGVFLLIGIALMLVMLVFKLIRGIIVRKL